MMELFIQQFANGIMSGSIYCLISVGVVLILSMMRLVNIAQGSLAILGAYACLLVMNRFNVNFWVGLLLAFLFVCAVSSVCERLVVYPVRRQKLPLFIAALPTIGVLHIIEESIAMLFGKNPVAVQSPYWAESVSLGPIQLSMMRLLMPVLALGLMALLMFLMYKTKAGRGLRAVSQDNEAASLMGINVNLMMNLGFVIGCGLSAIAGVCFAQMMPLNPYMGLSLLVKAWVIIIVGGMTSLPGAIVASYILGVGESLASGYLGAGFGYFFFFSILVLTLLVRPTGLFK